MSTPWPVMAACVAPLLLAVLAVVAAAVTGPVAWWLWPLVVVFLARVSYLCAELLERKCAEHDDPIY